MTINLCAWCGNTFEGDRSSRKYCALECTRAAMSRLFSSNNPAQRPINDRFFEKVNKAGEDECWIWTGAINRNGYGSILHQGSIKTASRVAYELQVGPIADGLHVLHHCDTPLCMNPRHLYLGDNKQNTKDRVERKRTGGIGKDGASAGERNIKAKLTIDAVKAIRSSCESSNNLGSVYGVDPNTIRSVRRKITWRHV